MPPEHFQCKRCGNCCLNLNDAYEGDGWDEDYERWKAEKRLDILDKISVIEVGGSVVAIDLWMGPDGDFVERCPWLRKLPGKQEYKCRINDTKPGVCREYPLSAHHAVETGCQGFSHLAEDVLSALLQDEKASGASRVHLSDG